MNSLFILPPLSLIAVAVLIPVARKLAARGGFVDRPGGRKLHERDVPPVGGLAIFPVFAILALFHGISLPEKWCLGALALLLLAGALDDRFSLQPWVKFGAQWIAAMLVVMPGNGGLHSLGDLLGFGPITLGAAGGIMFPAVALVLLINAINLMDGLDGLAAGAGLNTLVWLAVCCFLQGQGSLATLPMILAGALIGFLIYNLRNPWRRRASIFLGDSGSLALGLALGWFAIHLSQPPQSVIHPVTAAWLLALPIFDTCGQFARRVRQGQHPFAADSDHFHHHVLAVAETPGRATSAILILSALFGLIGVAGPRLGVPDWALGWLWTLLLLIHISLSMKPERFRAVLARLRLSAPA